jgi:hypothetical protein
MTQAPAAGAPAPLAVSFADLFDALGTADLRYSTAVRALSGRDIAIEGYLAHAHVAGMPASLVDQGGVCADCAPGPVAVIALPGLCAVHCAGETTERVRIVGRLDYGFRIDQGVASMLRIERAAVLPRDPSA